MKKQKIVQVDDHKNIFSDYVVCAYVAAHNIWGVCLVTSNSKHINKVKGTQRIITNCLWCSFVMTTD